MVEKGMSDTQEGNKQHAPPPLRSHWQRPCHAAEMVKGVGERECRCSPPPLLAGVIYVHAGATECKEQDGSALP